MSAASVALDLLKNPTVVTVVITGLITVFNYFAKPRTPEELAAMSPRKAAVHRFLNAVFPDPQKTGEAVWQFWNETHDRLPPKK